MKKHILTAVLALASMAGFAQRQDVMVIEKTDNTTLRLSVDDIRRVVFESAFVNPVGTLAEAIDLGLPSGVRWAKWNLGATAPSEYGGYYGWADPTGQKTSTDVNDYPSVNPPSEISGTKYDIVSQLWGGQWRLPTYDDIYELYENCDFYKSGNDVKVVGPNGNSIILPLAGSREGTEIYDDGTYAYFWAGTIHPDDNNCAWLFTLDMQNGKYGVAGGSRHFGLSIRPVWGTPKPVVTISVTTGTATDITQNSARIGGTVSGVDSRVTVGIVYGTSSTLSAETGTKVSTTSMGGYTVEVTNLKAGTTYYYCAYAEVDGQYYYGDMKNFETEAAPVSINVTTREASDIEETCATLNGSVSASNTTKSYTAGFFVATSGTPSSSNYTKKVESGNNKTGNYSASVSELTSSTTYYFRAYVLYDGTYYYGETKSFKTATPAPTTGTINGHEWVDLGLPSGTKWATCNVGASSSTAYGSYFAWGETNTKNSFTPENYKYKNVVNGYVSYSGCQDIGADISGTKYDAARSNWGSTWRMPTKDEYIELKSKCEIIWTTQSGVKGIKLTGPNGNSIFLPATGIKINSSTYYSGTDGNYWTGTEGASTYHYEAIIFTFSDNNQYTSLNDRNMGCTIRPVSN